MLVVVVGAGGLGVPVVWELATNSEAPADLSIRLIDPDVIALDNLPRQVLYDDSQLGEQKITALAAAIKEKNPELGFECVCEFLDRQNATTLFAGAALIIDATDGATTKLLINDYCVIHSVPFCHAGALGWEGQLLAVDPGNTTHGCLRCLFGELESEELFCSAQTCREAGIIGPVVGAIGTAQAGEALRLLNRLSEAAIKTTDFAVESDIGSRFLRFNLAALRWTESRVLPSRDCPLGCGIGVASNVITAPRSISGPPGISRAHGIPKDHSIPRDHIPRDHGVRRNRLDLRSKECPATFLYTKLAVERLAAGNVLDVRFRSSEAASRVAQSIQEEGYVLCRDAQECWPGQWQILIAREERSTDGA